MSYRLLEVIPLLRIWTQSWWGVALFNGDAEWIEICKRSLMRLLVVFGCSLCQVQIQAAQIQFVEVTTGAGLGYIGKSYGASWGDINGDD